MFCKKMFGNISVLAVGIKYDRDKKKRLVCLKVSLKRIISVFLVITTIKRERGGQNHFSPEVFSLILLPNAGIVSKSQYGRNI